MAESENEDYLTKEEIDNISNVSKGFDMLDKRNLLLEYVNDLDDIKNILMLRYHSEKLERNQNVKETKLYTEYPQFMKKLHTLLSNLKGYTKMTEFKKEIGEIYKVSESHIDKKIIELEKMINNKSFPILTAGEAKAGKSTFINLLLGADLMPMNVVTCTRMICEIRNSEKKLVTFTGDNKPEIVKKLDGEDFSDIFKTITQESNEEYTNASFEYPVNFLENYTYLVDSPGIGDTSNLETMTFDYLNKGAPAFIFVLNATNSNGLNIKAKQLIAKAKQELERATDKYCTECSTKNLILESFCQYNKAIFILNHWDIVKDNAKSETEVEEVREIIIREIKQLWNDSAEVNDQIFFISARQAKEWQKEGLVQQEIIKIRDCIRKLVVNLYQKNLENSLELLNIILCNMEKKILQKVNAIVDNKYCKIYDKVHAEQLCESLENLIKDMENRKSKIRMQLKPEFDRMAIMLTQHLKSKEVEERILEMCESKIQKNDNMDLLTIVFRKTLETKLYEEIKLWEQKTNQMDELYSKLNGLFEDNLSQISNEIKISNTLITKDSLTKAWNLSNQCEVTNFDKDFISKIEKVFIISTITLLFPVVALAGILATPLIMSHMFSEARANEARLAAFNKDPKNYLRDMITDNLQKLKVDDVRKSFFVNVQRKCEDHIKSFERFITIEISERRQLIIDIEKENREIPEILKSLSKLFYIVENSFGEYHNLKFECCSLQDNWTILVRRSEYEKLSFNEIQISQFIATGKHSLIFKNHNYSDMVFKTYSQKFWMANARFQMQEIDLLVKAPSEYVLRCRHICMIENDKVLLVLDNVDCNLHQYLIDNPELVIGNHENHSESWKKALEFILNVSIQLCSGLEYIHSYDPRMVHPDLRLDTILVRKTSLPEKVNIFICDACTNLPTQRSHKRSGSNLKETPEDAFDMGGYTKENIFRFGLILYKLTHFEKEKIIPESKVSFASMTKLFEDVSSLESEESDPKTKLEESDILPPQFKDLIKKCSSLKPEERPCISKCMDILKQIVKDINKPVF